MAETVLEMVGVKESFFRFDVYIIVGGGGGDMQFKCVRVSSSFVKM